MIQQINLTIHELLKLATEYRETNDLTTKTDLIIDNAKKLKAELGELINKPHFFAVYDRISMKTKINTNSSRLETLGLIELLKRDLLK